LPDPAHETGRRLRRALLDVAGGALALATVVAAGGGFTASVGGLVVRVHQPWRLLRF
jgi:hypothetical protein